MFFLPPYIIVTKDENLEIPFDKICKGHYSIRVTGDPHRECSTHMLNMLWGVDVWLCGWYGVDMHCWASVWFAGIVGTHFAWKGSWLKGVNEWWKAIHLSLHPIITTLHSIKVGDVKKQSTYPSTPHLISLCSSCMWPEYCRSWTRL